MIRRTASIVAFVTTAAAAIIAATIVSVGAKADEISLVETPAIAAAKTWRVGELSPQDLKDHYLACERAVTRGDFATPAVCAALYEELRVRAFEGDVDALLAWFKDAWRRRAETL